MNDTRVLNNNYAFAYSYVHEFWDSWHLLDFYKEKTALLVSWLVCIIKLWPHASRSYCSVKSSSLMAVTFLCTARKTFPKTLFTSYQDAEREL